MPWMLLLVLLLRNDWRSLRERPNSSSNQFNFKGRLLLSTPFQWKTTSNPYIPIPTSQILYSMMLQRQPFFRSLNIIAPMSFLMLQCLTFTSIEVIFFLFQTSLFFLENALVCAEWQIAQWHKWVCLWNYLLGKLIVYKQDDYSREHEFSPKSKKTNNHYIEFGNIE